MRYEQIVQFVQSIINSVQNTGIASVKEIERFFRKETISVKVTNPQGKVKVTGDVKVTNQQDVEKQIKNIALAIRELKKPLAALKKVEVTNMLKPQPFPKFPDFPKSFKVDNFPTETKISNMREFVAAVNKIVNAIDKLDLKPEVNVAAPVVNVPAPVVNVPEQKAPVVNVEKPDLSDIKEIVTFLKEVSETKPLAVRLSDGKKFYKALEKMADIYAGSSFSAFQTVGGRDGRAQLNARNEVKVTISDTWDTNDVDRVNTRQTYFGEETSDGLWRVRKVTKDGTLTSIRHATKRNNNSYDSYEAAWADRADLDYGYAREAL